MTAAARAVALGAVLVAVACTTHIAPYRPRQRHFDPGEYDTATIADDGSLYHGRGLYADTVARRIGDIVIVRIDERDNASRAATTKLDKKDAATYGVPAAVGLLAALQARYPDVDPAALFDTANQMKFAGSGSISRRGQLTATLPVRVQRVMANGDLYIEGTKVVLVGNEEHHLYVSGLVRQIDLADDGSVPSSRIADAEIEYTGRGDITDTQRRGWGSRLLARIWPF